MGRLIAYSDVTMHSAEMVNLAGRKIGPES